MARPAACPELVSREVVEADEVADAGVLSMRSLFWEDEAAEEVAGGFGEAGLEDPPPEATSRACSEAADLRPPAPLPVLAVSSLSDLSPPGAAGGVEGALCDVRSGHLLNSILLIFHNQGSVVKSVFSTNAHSRFASVVVDSVQDLRAWRGTPDNVLVSL